MFNFLTRRVTALRNSFKREWLLLRIRATRKLWAQDKPAEFLNYCAKSLIVDRSFRLTATMRGVTIVAPQPAERFTEILSRVSEALTEDKNVKVVFDLGPFQELTPLAFLTKEDGTIFDSGVHHVIFHLAVIEMIAQYVTTTNEGESYRRNNTRILTPMLGDFQRYVDSILELYK